METNNWRPAQAGGEPAMDTGDWRAQLHSESRQRIVNKIMDTLQRHLPASGVDGINELRKIAVKFEDKIYNAATSQSDYLRRISMKMLSMEGKSQSALSNSLQSVAGNANNAAVPNPALHSMQSQVHSQGQSLPMSLPANQSQPRQLLAQNIQGNMISGAQGSVGLPSSVPPVSGLSQTTIQSTVGQNSNMQNISGISQNIVGASMGQVTASNMFANSQRQMQGRQPVLPQQQQQSQNPQYLYHQQQFQQQLLKQKFQQGHLSHSLMSSHMPQQQLQNLLQPTQLQSSQQGSMQTSSVMQPSVMHSASLSAIQQNQQSSVQHSGQSMLQQAQSVLRQQQQQVAGIHPQQTPMSQQSIVAPQQQQQQMIGQQTSTASMQQNQLIGQQNSVGDMQQQQQQRLFGQQNNLPSLQHQQQQQQQQQQLMAQQNNLSNIHQQHLGPQSNVSGLQQPQQLLGTQSSNSGMQTNQHSLHMVPQSKVSLQQTQQSSASLLAAQGQQSQSQPQQLQQQIGLQQLASPLQRDMQQRFQASGSLLQPQNVMDQQKQQLYQSQRVPAETSSTSLDSTAQTGNANSSHWQEEIFQKIKTMRDAYFPELNDLYQKISAKLQQLDSLPQQSKTEQFERLKMFRHKLDRMMAFLNVQKSSILPGFKESVGIYEKQIISFINSNKPRKPLHQGQLPPPHMTSMQQSQSQISQGQSYDNQMNPQLQSMNLQVSVPSMQQQNGMTSLQHGSLSSLSGVSTTKQNMLNSLQPGSNLDSGQGSVMSSLQQISLGSLQQNPGSSSQPANMNLVSSQSGANSLQPNINPLQANFGVLQSQHLKQQELQILQTQQFKQQLQQRHIQQHLIQKQQLPQQQQHQQQLQQQKQQLPAQLQAHQIPQLHQMSDMNDLKIRQGIGVKSGVFQQHMSAAQRSSYPLQQLKPGTQFPISSPQLLQATSPQIPQHSSPQLDQHNLLASVTKTGTPLQSASSPFIVPSPSTPLAPSPMPGDSEKPISCASSFSNSANIGHPQTTGGQGATPSLAIGTPGISASPLLAEFSGPDGPHGNAPMTLSGRSTVTEQPLDRLIKAVKSISSKALSASVSDIGSVVSMTDRIAGSAPGNGSRAAVGEDLVAMTKCRLQAKNLLAQDGIVGNKKMRCYTSAMSLNVVSPAGSINDNIKQLTGSEISDLESTATSRVKRPRTEANHALLDEIKEINQRLIDTVVDICDDVDPSAAAAASPGEGTVVNCSFSAVALCPDLKSQYSSAQMSPIQPLRLFVPTNYPSSSPILLDNFPVEDGKEMEDISVKAKSKLSISLRSLSQPISLGDIARTWDTCARAVISEYAQQSGGGTFSSKYGPWENCLSLAQ